jgi:hypothetical protein
MNDNININDSHLNPSMTFRRLCFLHMQQLTNFPYIEKDFDALTDYELLCLVVKYLNDVINNSNKQNESITNLYNAFLDLQTYMNNSVEELEDAFNELNDYVRDYFANLDVQEEINNKLDEMLEDGVLEQIIEQYINSTAIWCFDTVASMKSATNLINGSYARTVGYYSLNDGGGATYKITDTESETEYQEELNSGLYATLILNDEMNILQFGAKPNDNTFNNSNIIQSALNTKKHIYIGNNIDDVFYITNFLRIYNDVTFNSWISILNSTGINTSRVLVIDNYTKNKPLIINNPLINGNRDETILYPTSGYDEYAHAIDIRGSNNIIINNGKLIKCYGDGICISASNETDAQRYCKNININNVYINDNYRNAISIISGVDINVNNCETYNNNGYRAILIEPNNDATLINKNILINNTYIYSNKNGALDMYAVKPIENVQIKKCIFEVGANGSTPIRKTGDDNLTNILIEDSKIINNRASNQMFFTTNGDIIINNLEITGTEGMPYIGFISNNGNIDVNNYKIKFSDNTKRAVHTITAPNGKVNVTNSQFLTKNASNYYSGNINVIGKDINISNNVFNDVHNAIAIGRAITGSTLTHEYSCDIARIENNTIIEDSSYDNEGLVITLSIDVDTVIYNFNYFKNVSRIYRDYSNVTTKIGNNIPS